MEVRTHQNPLDPQLISKRKVSDIDSASILHLIESLNSSCCLTLQRKINAFLQYQIQCRTLFMLYLLEESEEAIIQVIGDMVLAQELRFPIPSQAILSTISNKQNETLDKDLEIILKDELVPYPKSMLKVPVRHPEKDGHISVIVCIADYQKIDNCEYHYSMIVKECFRFCIGVLLNAFKGHEEERMKKQCQKLLSIAKNFLLHLGDLDDLLKEIIIEARLLTNAERCSLFLTSEDGSELVAKVFDGVPQEQAQELRIPIGQGIAGRVVTTGEILNIRDAYNHPLFYKGVDEATGFKTRNILCFPIRDDRDHIVGVAQLCNKQTGFYFDTLDEQAATAFSIYCGISIMHSIVYRKIRLSQARSRLANELMMYHMMVHQDDVNKVVQCTEDHDYTAMQSFMWIARDVVDVDSTCFAINMFESLGLMKTWRIQRDTLARFILFVQKGYRDVPYHNWAHAFGVTHFGYFLMSQMKLIEKAYITELEAAAFLVSCLCHDLDHRGTTNSFQTMAKNTLASLYSSEGSVLERHHFSQTLCILNTEGCNIFENLSCQEYTRVLDLIRDLILATDLSAHFKLLPTYNDMYKAYDSSNDNHRAMLLRLMMTCCDLNDQTKGWIYSKMIAEMIYNEFFLQGDMEKAMGNDPAVMMDREKAQIPNLQCEFLNDVCVPSYTLLVGIFPELSECLTMIKRSAESWHKSISWFVEHVRPGRNSLDILRDPSLERYVLDKS